MTVLALGVNIVPSLTALTCPHVFPHHRPPPPVTNTHNLRMNDYTHNKTQLYSEINKNILLSDKPNRIFNDHLTENVVLIVRSLVLHTLKDKQLVLYHDAQTIPLAVLNQLMTSVDIPGSVLVFDVTQTTLASQHWLGDYNDAMFVHILLFEDPLFLDQFTSFLTPKVWRPFYLLLVSLNTTFPKYVLENSRFNRSPFLSLLQPSLRCDDPFSRYLIITYESFRKEDKVRTRGSFLPENTITLQDLFPDRFPNFHGHHFHLASFIADYPYLHGDLDENVQGMCYRMLEEISHRLNFTFKVYDYPPDFKWGDFNNGTWSGMIGEVFREENWSTWVSVVVTLLLVTTVQLFFARVKGLEGRRGGLVVTAMEVTRTILRLDPTDLSSHDSIRSTCSGGGNDGGDGSGGSGGSGGGSGGSGGDGGGGSGGDGSGGGSGGDGSGGGSGGDGSGGGSSGDGGGGGSGGDGGGGGGSGGDGGGGGGSGRDGGGGGGSGGGGGGGGGDGGGGCSGGDCGGGGSGGDGGGGDGSGGDGGGGGSGDGGSCDGVICCCCC
ncbi:hypothetical protein Pcinc_020164 [Petrolisthes cinctipes]|uniref:Ionotropic glutamate receptor L-glutamate and glycine-binding domain-containing protein n=1 Tax=Petrolisthes cinctipes TaxID=88211 RepID=A0AAE1FIL8_PETCI|nr:hypothetical protein Pcinc_020164 [Petrolisthes cinctipes]